MSSGGFEVWVAGQNYVGAPERPSKIVKMESLPRPPGDRARYLATGTPMNTKLPRTVVAGIIGGALVGFLIGAYVTVLTGDHVIRRDDYVHPRRYEQAQSRYTLTMVLAFVTVFAAIGPVVANASFGRWIRHAVYGLVGGVGLVVLVTIIAAAFTNQQPINMSKGSRSTFIDMARNYGVPVALIIGPVAGIMIGRSKHSRPREAS